MSAEARLRERIEELEEENRQLRNLLKPPVTFPLAWGLSRQKAALLAALYARSDVIGHQTLRIAVCGFDGEQCEYFITALASQLRRKLRSTGIEIINVHGHGYYLSSESREIIADALSALKSERGA